MKNKLLFYIIFFLTIPIARAELYPSLYRGARSHAMGDTDIAVVNDETALLVNPAALGKLRNIYGTLIDPEVEMGTKSYAISLKKCTRVLYRTRKTKEPP